MTDKELDELEARLREAAKAYWEGGGYSTGGEFGHCMENQAADAIAELRKKNAGLVGALDKLLTASTTVSDLGAQTGSQWVKLTTAILKARAALKENTQ